VKQPIDGTQIVSRETQERLEAFTALLLAWNRTINLIARGDEANVWQRHIVDSLQLIPHIPAQANSAIDLGSGGGLPGLVLAIATGLPFTLIESDQRKCAFLREATRATAAQVTVLCERIERAELPPTSLVTTRALAALPNLLPLAARFLTKDGILLALKGRNVDNEITAAQHDWHLKIRRETSRTDAAATLLIITEVSRVRSNE
jgi:16S rRNA (guanine527-N7)-methyltransferase